MRVAQKGAQQSEVINEYSYRKVSNEAIAATIKDKIAKAITNSNTVKSLYNDYPGMQRQHTYKNVFFQLCDYFYNDTFNNDPYVAFDNDVPDSTALKRDDSNPMSTEELSYLHNFTFTFFINCLVTFDSKEKARARNWQAPTWKNCSLSRSTRRTASCSLNTISSRTTTALTRRTGFASSLRK